MRPPGFHPPSVADVLVTGIFAQCQESIRALERLVQNGQTGPETSSAVGIAVAKTFRPFPAGWEV